jgi:hypothetical protein
MKLSARVRANRANARRSTGPKTPAGKSAASRNALRHGLAVALTADPNLAGEADRFASMIAGEAANEARFELARRVAEAQVDLLRVRRARSLLLDEVRARAKSPSVSEAIGADRYTANRVLKARNPSVAFWERMRAVLRALNAGDESGDAMRGEGIAALVVQLERFDRYERRALSRRKWATRDFDEFHF